MNDVFLISDPHFSHANICTFFLNNGEPARPFDDIDVMDETIISNFNKMVTNSDKTYFLGDVVFSKAKLNILERMNGKKVLILGNHDKHKTIDYLKYFKDVRSSHLLDNYILTHIPIHPGSKSRFKGNIHGHLHNNRVLLPNGEIDPWYFSVCVELTDYRPMYYKDVIENFKWQSL